MHALKENTTIFTYDFMAVSLINLFVMAAYYLLFVISSPYAARQFQASPSVSGLIAGMMVLGCLAGRFVCGKLIGSVGFKKVLFSGLALYMVSIGLYLTANSLILLIIVRFLGGIGIGSISTVTGTMAAVIVPARQRGLGLSYFSLSTIIALAAGPFLGIFLMRFMSFNALFLLCLGLGAVSCVIAFFLHLPDDTVPHEHTPLAINDFIEPKVIPISCTVLLSGFCYGAVQAFLSTYASSLHLDNEASIYFLVYAAAVFMSRPITGRIIDAKGENIVAYPALLFMVLSLALLGLAGSSWMLLLSGVLLGLGFGNFQSTAQVASFKLVPKDRFGQVNSTFYIFLDLGIGLGPYILGLLVPAVGFNGLYLAAACVSLVTIPLYCGLHGKKARPSIPAHEAG